MFLNLEAEPYGLLFQISLQQVDCLDSSLNLRPGRRILFHQFPKLLLFPGQSHPKILPPLLVFGHQALELLALLGFKGQGTAKLLHRQARPGLSPAGTVNLLPAEVSQGAEARQIEGEGKDQQVEKPGAFSRLFFCSHPSKV
jgi:hypothetical protein